ncbi:major facilitator superfamily domain-containing protein [Dendryphion nanum]|uniref:Major facilitator superfamily domain-containing protein n=1 Tax=Dendryphion nanum TaxID=256645 RepID=A0A9P9CZE9_9PLEO|nr:major facilitator superfamily domain-containing protein [Dendryphion nanum]
MNERQKHDSFILSGSVFLITSDGKTLNLPVPSSNPCDPLNWGWQKRAFTLVPISIYAISAIIVTQGEIVIMRGLKNEFPEDKRAPFTMEDMITAPTLFMGIGALFWIPLTTALGRRPPFIMASLLLLLACLVAGTSTNFRVLIACISVIGFCTGFSLSAIYLIVIDITFIHQRPRAIAMVWAFIGGVALNLLGSVPFLTDHGNQWRNLFLYWSIPIGISCLLAIICFPETYFKRPTVAYDGLTILQSASEKLIIYEDDLSDPNWSLYNKDLPAPPTRNCFQKFVDQYCFRITRASWKTFIYCFPQMFFCALNPLIFWVLILTATNFAGMMFIGATYGIVLTSDPYNLPSRLLVLVSTSCGFGTFLAWPLGGCLVCLWIKKLAKRNKGVREAEHYLVAYILPVLTGAASTIIYGCAVEFNWHYTMYYLAYGLNGFSFVTLGMTNTLWVTEAFPRWAAPALAVVSGGSYITSFAMSYALNVWIPRHGYLKVGIELTVLQIVTGLIIWPIFAKGKGVRQRINGRWGKWAEGREGALRPL